MYVHEDQAGQMQQNADFELSFSSCSAQKRLSATEKAELGLSSPPLKCGRWFAMETRPAFAESQVLSGLCCFCCFQQSV